jgi:hypothetical protein
MLAAFQVAAAPFPVKYFILQCTNRDHAGLGGGRPGGGEDQRQSGAY